LSSKSQPTTSIQIRIEFLKEIVKQNKLWKTESIYQH